MSRKIISKFITFFSNRLHLINKKDEIKNLYTNSIFSFENKNEGSITDCKIQATLFHFDQQMKANTTTSPFFTERTLSRIINENSKTFSVYNWLNETLFKQPQVLYASIISVIIGVAFGLLLRNNLSNISQEANQTILNSTEQVYYSGVSSTYLPKFFENQIPKQYE